MSPEQASAYLAKGCVDLVSREALEAKLARRRPLTVKVGFDPTAPDIHLGHAVLMRKMRHFQDLGHRVVFVIGDFTGMIGDPSGKSKARPPLSRQDIEQNAETYKKQAFKILHPEKTEIRFNREWLGRMSSDDWIRLAATYNVARMLERRDFRQRYEAGQAISIHEFLYPLAQAYDSVALEADVELGGTDQLFNLNVGRDIMPAYGLEPQVVMTTPLLEGLDGVEKMSKSLDNYVGVSEPPETMYAKLLSISDDLMWRYYLLLTDLAPDALEAERARAQPMESKLGLARRIVGDFHGADAAEAAEAEWRRVHQRRELPAEIQEHVHVGEFKAHELLVEFGLAASKSEAVRLLRQGAVKVRMGDETIVLGPAHKIEMPVGGRIRVTGPPGQPILTSEQAVVSVGPRRHVRLRPGPG